MSTSALERVREVVASIIWSPLYFKLTPPQRLALVKALVDAPYVRHLSGKL